MQTTQDKFENIPKHTDLGFLFLLNHGYIKLSVVTISWNALKLFKVVVQERIKSIRRSLRGIWRLRLNPETERLVNISVFRAKVWHFSADQDFQKGFANLNETRKDI